MNITIAASLAKEKIKELSRLSNDKYELIFEFTEEVKNGWVFFYNTADFIKSGNPMDGLAGNSPIFISRSGVVSEIPSHLSWHDWLSEHDK